MSNHRRKPSGTPQGGQWAPSQKAEAAGTDALAGQHVNFDPTGDIPFPTDEKVAEQKQADEVAAAWCRNPDDADGMTITERDGVVYKMNVTNELSLAFEPAPHRADTIRAGFDMHKFADDDTDVEPYTVRKVEPSDDGEAVTFHDENGPRDTYPVDVMVEHGVDTRYPGIVAYRDGEKIADVDPPEEDWAGMTGQHLIEAIDWYERMVA